MVDITIYSVQTINPQWPLIFDLKTLNWMGEWLGLNIDKIWVDVMVGF